MESYQCIIVGGGIAGLQAAIQLGRYGHNIAVIDKGEGRSTLCKCYHNVLGWPEGVEGNKLRHLGKKHAQKYGVHFLQDEVVSVSKTDNEHFILIGNSDKQYMCRYLLFATGIKDRLPLEIPNLKECLGLSIYICPDCDGYEVKNKKVIVAGSGDVGANMALTLTYWTDQIVYINSEEKEINQRILVDLNGKGIEVINEKVVGVETESKGVFSNFSTSTGKTIKGECGFLAFGGNKVNTELLQQLGAERLENDHVTANPRSKETSIPNVWVAGDIGVHSELLTIAMGEGAQSAIWIHKRILQENESK